MYLIQLVLIWICVGCALCQITRSTIPNTAPLIPTPGLDEQLPIGARPGFTILGWENLLSAASGWAIAQLNLLTGDDDDDDTLAPIGAGCSVGWTEYNDHCYKFTGVESFYVNMLTCNTLGAELACITTEAEAEFVNNLIFSKFGTFSKSIQINYNDLVTEDTFECDGGEVPDDNVVKWSASDPGGGDVVVLFNKQYYNIGQGKPTETSKHRNALCKRKKSTQCHVIGLD